MIFEGSESIKDATQLERRLILVDGPSRISDRFLRLHFQRCLAVSACNGDITEDYGNHEIECFMEELGVFDNAIDASDPRWMTTLGKEVYAHLLRERLVK